MKKIVFFIALAVFGTVALTAQDQDRNRDQDRLMMVDGDVLQIRDRDQIRLRNPLTLNDGTILYPNGTYKTRNGKQLRLQDGECIDMYGIKYNNEYQYRYKVRQENKGLTMAQIQERDQNRVHLMLVDGEVVQIRNQSQNRLQEKLDLGNGMVVNPDGSYQIKDRKQLRLQDGECLSMDGKTFKNMYLHRKTVLQKNMMKKGIKKPNIQKRKKSTD